jgi:ribosome-associated translation inhibitor RaiA
MQIQINTDKNVEGTEQFSAHARQVIESALGRFRDRITRVEAHLSDENSEKSGPNDKRCAMEARLEGRKSTAVTHSAATVEAALDGAAAKLARVIEHTLARLMTEASRRTDPAPPA